MTPEAIQKHRLSRPFRPFRVFLSDRAVYEVLQPEMVLVLQREVIIGLPKLGERFPRHTISCDPRHITRIESIDGHSAEPRSKTRR